MELSLFMKSTFFVLTSLPYVNLAPLESRRGRGLWITPVRYLDVINAYALARWALAVDRYLHSLFFLSLPSGSPAGCNPTYTDETILLTSLIAGAWRCGYEKMTRWLRRDDELAWALGYPIDPGTGHPHTISSAQYWRRVKRLHLGPYFLFFTGLVYQLLKLGVIRGTDVILDATLLKAWVKADLDAMYSYPTKWKGSIFGYKLHALTCRWSSLPLLFFVTPANVSDSVMAIPLLVATVFIYELRLLIVRADAAYFTHKIFDVIRRLGATFIIDYNLRRKGKKYLATYFFIHQWRFHLRPRTDIERYFTRLKRYFGLKYFQAEGLENVYRYAFLANISMLAVALIACRYQRPELKLKRSEVLAIMGG